MMVTEVSSFVCEYYFITFQSEFQALLPKVLVAIKTLLTRDEDQAAEAMELFDVLAECEVQ